MTLRFEDVKYEVDVGDPKNPQVKPILKGLSGQVEPSSLLSIMGASGAGKTTLLNILAGRLSAAGGGRTSGRILVNGQQRNYSTFRKLSAYVLQNDVFYAELTVRETITISAKLRLPADMSKEERQQRIDNVIAELGLKKCEDTLVGNDVIRGVSGGERKRCNIGTELVTNPTLVFCDEPTSGLDAFNAQNVMSSLLTLARAGRTVIATIHQPRSEIFGMLDQLMLLSEGHTMYFGKAANAVNYFDQLGYGCPPTYNPSDWFLDLVSLDIRNRDAERQTKKRIQYLAERFRDYEQKHPMSSVKTIRGGAPLALTSSDAEAGRTEDPDSNYAVSWGRQFWILLQRAATITSREKATNMARFIQSLIFGLLLGLIWLQEGGDESTRVRSTAGALFFLIMNQSFGGVFSIIFVFPEEKAIIHKERSSRSYQVGAYFWSKMLVNIPRSLLANLIFAIISYFMIGFRLDAGSFFGFLLVVFLATQAAESIAYCVSAISDTAQKAGAIAPIFVVTSMLFGGFFISQEDIPVWLSWLQYLSYVKYAFAGLMQMEYQSRDLDSSGCDFSDSTESTFCPPTGADVLDYYDINEINFGINVLALVLMAVGFRACAYGCLRGRGPKYDTTI
ncbi:uncharacterized protein MONBRDRAFT_34196 [Monosiga brevicollis MX1]|uniref:ABC transporter domain-containing protein n=1 Tax=Monosiga brevicollis TaxID=81824 RepID=A9VA57_MONBE|nr:uncharacterized protein MONBRDRAFT_34196 [Monosiga brevicollis MX1]EDQ85608.1 predicted protein [Monosiga brevicollis MX1]|eukprot:XP_001749557.1 hypothetical protein [Monosiga brevicollis MX1]